MLFLAASGAKLSYLLAQDPFRRYDSGLTRIGRDVGTICEEDGSPCPNYRIIPQSYLTLRRSLSKVLSTVLLTVRNGGTYMYLSMYLSIFFRQLL